MSLSIIVPTCGRATLARTLDSVVPQLQRSPVAGVDEGDEVIVVGGPADAVAPYVARGVRHEPHRAMHHWGCEERTRAIALARQSHLAFIDDDDYWTPDARVAIAEAVAEYPEQPILFRMQYVSGGILWRERAVRCGNVSTQMIVVPNDPLRLGVWTTRRAGDFDFIASWRWRETDIVWREAIIARVGRR
jgi:glycosyltransferase involved in cell wall biosynthesis